MITFHVVCQAGILESLSAVCVGSLLLNLRCEAEIVVGHPARFGPLSPATESFLDASGVTVVPIENDFEPEYAIANKVLLFSRPANGAKIAIDADGICARPFAGELLPDSAGAVPHPAFCPKFGHPKETWRAAFAHFGLTLPDSTDSYSASFVYSPSDSFPHLWLATLREIHRLSHETGVPIDPKAHKARQYDQFALAIAAALDPTFTPLPKWVNEQGRYMLVNTPEHFYRFRDGRLVYEEDAFFYILQRKYLFREERQGRPGHGSPTPNTLYYYPELRRLVGRIIRRWPMIESTPSWPEYVRLVLGSPRRMFP